MELFLRRWVGHDRRGRLAIRRPALEQMDADGTPSVPAGYGPRRVSWIRETDGILHECQRPTRATRTVHLPGSSDSQLIIRNSAATENFDNRLLRSASPRVLTVAIADLASDDRRGYRGNSGSGAAAPGLREGA